jgi:NitT/TauT family transport system permease protein
MGIRSSRPVQPVNRTDRSRSPSFAEPGQNGKSGDLNASSRGAVQRIRRYVANRQVWLAIIGIVAFVGVWQLLFMSGQVPTYMLPSPLQVTQNWIALWHAGVIWRDTKATLTEAMLGFGAALVVGVGLGYPIARSHLLDELVAPYLAASQAMPVIAFAPLLVTWFGVGLFPKVIICALIVFFPILINTVVGFREVDPQLIKAARGLGARELRVFWHVELPLALRTFMGGVRMGVTLSMAGAVVAEFVAADAGLGYLMNLGRTEYRAPIVFSAAFTMAFIGIAGYVAVMILERILIRWE